jgi:hypothetical protein
VEGAHTQSTSHCIGTPTPAHGQQACGAEDCSLCTPRRAETGKQVTSA